MRRYMCSLMAIIIGLTLIFVVRGEASEIRLTSDIMYYDSASGKMRAEGNVKLTREKMVIDADKGEGDYGANTARLWGDVHGHGQWNGDKIDFRCDEISASFGDLLRYSLKGKVDAVFGPRQLEAYEVEFEKGTFLADKVRRFHDGERQMTLSTDRIHGRLEDGLVSEFVADGKVDLRAVNKKNGVVTRIRGGKAVYSKARGTLVISGNAMATQKGRRITARSIVFFPNTNRIEAKGNPQVTFELKDAGK